MYAVSMLTGRGVKFRVPKRYLPVKKGFPRIPGGTHLLCKD